ncbi:MAG: glycosyltransferase [Clostridia bacterium]|nr:glycosyltransferase [Clostridia bacterium]
MKILEVLDCYYPKFDGPCLVITSYSNSMLKMKDTIVKVAVPKFPKYKDNQKFTVFRTKSIPSAEGYRCALPGLDSKLKRFLKENEFDIIHIHSPFTMCAYFTKYGKKHNIPTIFTFHTKYRDDFERDLKLKCLQNFMMKYILKNMNRADHVWTVSDGAKECLREYGYKKPIKVIRNGTDLVYPDNAEKLIDKINEKYGFDKDETVFLSVGRIVENKNLQLALSALKMVAEDGFRFKYMIVGSGNYENELKESVEKYGLRDQVIFTGKILDREELSAHYLRSDLFIFPSTFDTASLAPIEAAAMKLPTLMNEGCATAEIIENNINGYLAEETTVAWANRIEEIIKNKDKLKKMKDAAYKGVYRTWDSVAEEVVENYKEIVKNHKK